MTSTDQAAQQREKGSRRSASELSSSTRRTRRCLVIMPSARMGGAQMHAEAVCFGAAQHQVEAAYGVRPSPDNAAQLERMRANGIEILDLPLEESDSEGRRRTSWLRDLLRTLVLMRRGRYKATLVILPVPDCGLGAAIAGVISGVPTAYIFQLVTETSALSPSRARMIRWAVRNGLRLIAISENNRMLVSRMCSIGREEIQVIYNGAVLPALSGCDKNASRNELVVSLGLPSNATIVLSVGRLCYQKGYDLLCQAIPHLIRDYPNLHFVWAGSEENSSWSESVSDILARPEVSCRIHKLGWVSDPGRLYLAADYFVLPTRFEGGQAIAISEAMASGVPVIASSASGIPEILRHEVDGLLFRVGDACDLLETLRRALREPDLLRFCAENAAERIRGFSTERCVAETLATVGL